MNEKISPKELTNKELDKLLDEADWCDKELLKEHDERLKDGRIKSRGMLKTKEELEEYFANRRANKLKKKAS